MSSFSGLLAYHRPNGKLLEEKLRKEEFRMVAVVIRLAWQLGLLRQEIHDLTWEDVDFASSLVRLSDRDIPMSPELQVYLQGLQIEQHRVSGPVVLSDRDRRQPAEQHLSYTVRQLMNEIGQDQVRLLDLRYDYIDRQLQRYSWEYVSRVAKFESKLGALYYYIMPRLMFEGNIYKTTGLYKLYYGIEGELQVTLIENLTFGLTAYADGQGLMRKDKDFEINNAFGAGIDIWGIWRY